MVKLSLACSLAGLAAIYGATLSARPKVTPIAAIDNNFVGLKVIIAGQVIDCREHGDGHLFLKVRDDSGGVVAVPLFSRLRQKLEGSVELLDFVEVKGEVKLYREELEVVPSQASEVRVIRTAPVGVSSISKDNVGNPVKVQGVVAEREIVGAGHLVLVLRENGSELPVFIPAWIAGNGPSEAHVGDTICAGGWLQLYKGELELKVTGPSSIRVVEGA
jgi:DNA/RNA endonuclease YhcR with UshA esterase domain